jgi:hypothetical protein
VQKIVSDAVEAFVDSACEDSSQLTTIQLVVTGLISYEEDLIKKADETNDAGVTLKEAAEAATMLDDTVKEATTVEQTINTEA